MRNQNAKVRDRSKSRFAVVHAVVRRKRRPADLSGGKNDDFAAGSGEVPDRAQRAKTALTIFEGTFAPVTKMRGRSVGACGTGSNVTLEDRGATIEQGRLVAIGTRAFLITFALENPGATDIGGRKPRIDLDGLVQVSECPTIAAFLEPYGAPITVDLRIGEAHAHGTVEIDERLVEFHVPLPHQAAIMEDGGIVRGKSKRHIVMCARP